MVVILKLKQNHAKREEMIESQYLKHLGSLISADLLSIEHKPKSIGRDSSPSYSRHQDDSLRGVGEAYSRTGVGIEDLLHASRLLDLELHLLPCAVLYLDGDGLGLSLLGHGLSFLARIELVLAAVKFEIETEGIVGGSRR